MKWLKRKIILWLQDDELELVESTGRPVRERDIVKQNGLSFTLYKAVGGHVLETRVYNSRTDNHEGTLYMIHDDEDFSKQVAQAIMLESMKQ